MFELNRTIQGDVLEVLPQLPDGIANCCITSPPYWGLRDYGVSGQLGLEDTPEEYIEKMVQVFRQVRRVLADDGTLWLNIGDTYWGGKGKSGAAWDAENNHDMIGKAGQPVQHKGETRPQDRRHEVIKPKDLVGIPWMLALALRADGWYLRQDIIWHKPNPMPESVQDRCTKAHEYIFLLSKSRMYYFNQEAIKEPASNNTHERQARAKGDHKSVPDDLKNGIRVSRKARNIPTGWNTMPGKHTTLNGHYPRIKNNESFDLALKQNYKVDFRNKRSVWTVSPENFPEAHFATFPQELILPCIQAGCKGGGTVLDPFHGSGTTGIVARKQDRNFIGIELSPVYIEIEQRRKAKELGMFV